MRMGNQEHTKAMSLWRRLQFLLSVEENFEQDALLKSRRWYIAGLPERVATPTSTLPETSPILFGSLSAHLDVRRNQEEDFRH